MFEDRRAALGAGAQRLLAGKVHQLARVFGGGVVAKVELELVVAAFLIVHDGDLGHEGPACLGAKAVQRAQAAVAQQLLGLGRLEGAACRRLGEREAAARALSVTARAAVAPVVLLDHAAAVGARRGQGGVVAGHGVPVVFLGLLDQLFRHGLDLLHEGIARELALFHLRQLVFPFAGEVGAREFFHAQAAQQGHELEGLGRGNQLAAFAQHVLFGQQAFDDGRARGRRAQALFLHGLAQLVVLDLLAGAFHGAQQRGFGVARGRLGLEALGIDLAGARLLAGLHRDQGLALVAVLAAFDLVGGLLAVDGQPTGLDQDLAFGLEAVLLDLADARGHLVLGAGEEHGHEAAHDEVIELLLGLGQAAGRLRGRDDGKVIRHLAVVEDALGRAHIVLVQRLLGKGCQVAHAAAGQHGEGLVRHGHVVLGQGTRVGTRVGQGLVALVQALRQRQRGLGREAELAVGLALQAGQVEQQRAGLGRGLGLLGDLGRLAAHGVGNGLGIALVPDAVGAGFRILALLPLRVEPLAQVLAGLRIEGGMHFPVVAAHELADLFLALHHQGQRGRLHAAHGGQEEAAIARIEGRHGARAVDAHQPVGLGAAARGAGQAQHLRVAAQVLEAVADGLRRHGLQPQALDRLAQALAVGLGACGVLLDQAEDQLTLAARVAGVDEFGDILALGQLDHGIEPALGLVHGLEVEIRRNHRQVGKTPFTALDVELLGRLDFHQVAHGAGHDVVLALEVFIVLVEFARHRSQRADDVLRDRRLLSNHQGLCHCVYSSFPAGPACRSLRFYNPWLTRVRTCTRTRMCAYSSYQRKHAPHSFGPFRRPPYPDPPLGCPWQGRLRRAGSCRRRGPCRVRRGNRQLAGSPGPASARPQPAQPYLLLPRGRRPRDRRQLRRQLLALDQPQLRSQLLHR